MGEIGHAVTEQALSLEDANQMVLRLLEKYEHIFSNPAGNPGQSFEKAYNLDQIEPVPGWDSMYKQVKEEVIKLGFEQLL